ncbi:MAG: hypothetical protein ACRESI_05370 [Gammaproteobacteria bacterium]
MNDSARMTGKKLDAFLSKLAELIDNLPTTEAKDLFDKELQTIIEYLKGIQERMKTIPSGEDAEGIIKTIETLKDYIRIAESDPILSRVLGLSSTKTDRKLRNRTPAVNERIIASEIAEKYKQMSPTEVQSDLSDKKEYTNALLRQIGNELGLKIPSKATRVSILEKITKKVSNLRGYDYLRHRTDE